jgi:hypothetical protein
MAHARAAREEGDDQAPQKHLLVCCGGLEAATELVEGQQHSRELACQHAAIRPSHPLKLLYMSIGKIHAAGQRSHIRPQLSSNDGKTTTGQRGKACVHVTFVQAVIRRVAEWDSRQRLLHAGLRDMLAGGNHVAQRRALPGRLDADRHAHSRGDLRSHPQDYHRVWPPRGRQGARG